MEEIFADYNDMIYADSRPQIEAKRKAFFRSAVADSLEEVGDKLFIFTHFSKSQWSRLRSHRRVAPLRVAHRTSIRTSKSDASATSVNLRRIIQARIHLRERTIRRRAKTGRGSN